MKRFLLLFLTMLMMFLTACSGGTEAADGRLRVVATTDQITDALTVIAGEAAAVEGLFGPGIDPHLYVPTEGDVTTLAAADVIFYNGLHLEAQMTRVLDQMESRGTTVVSLGDSLPADRLLRWDDDTPYDPHFWNDPALWIETMGIIRDTLAAADPANAAIYEANTAAYIAEIEAVNAFVRQQIDSIAPERRVMITAHDAFGYFARAYGLEERGLQGISTESEAGTQDVQLLADFIVERQIPAIFVESSVPPDTIEAVQAAVQDRGFAVTIGGELFSDALAEEGHEADNYLGMLQHNARTLAAALGETP